MKSAFESKNHSQIRAIKKELCDEAIAYLKSGTIGRRLAEIIGDNGTPGDTAERLILSELNGGDRRIIRNTALGGDRSEKRELKLQGKIRRLLKKVRAAKGNTQLPEEPQKNEKPPITLEAIREWLGQLGDVRTRREQSKAGLGFLASVKGCVLVHNRMAGGSYIEEIPGETAEAAIRNYFTAAVNVAYIEGPKGEQYIWSQRELNFIKRESQPNDDPLVRKARKASIDRKGAKRGV